MFPACRLWREPAPAPTAPVAERDKPPRGDCLLVHSWDAGGVAFEIGFAGSTFDPRERLKDDEPEEDVTTWIVQFRRPLDASDVQQLRSAPCMTLDLRA
jgi:hypothetical protein